MRKLFHAAAAVLVTALVAAPAKADPVVLDQWYTFGFGPTGSSLVDGTGFVQGVNPPRMPAPDPAWTFPVLDPVELILLDGFAAGDQFSIFNFGVLLGNTSAPTDDGTNCGSDITACLAEDAISKATFLLAPGSYSLTGTV